MTCPCEACKEVRAARPKKPTRAELLKRATLAEGHMGIYKGRLNRFEDILGRIESSKDAEWVSGDGRKIRVQSMSDSHLHYAIAKGYRGEYPNSYCRSTIHLKNEALRRLIGGTWPSPTQPPKA